MRSPSLQRTRSRLGATAVLALAISGWHAPLFLMGVFATHPIGFVTTVAVTFWYAWLFNHASGRSLLTLIAHGVEGGVRITSLVGRRTGPRATELDLRDRLVPRRPRPPGRRPALLGEPLADTPARTAGRPAESAPVEEAEHPFARFSAGTSPGG